MPQVVASLCVWLIHVNVSGNDIARHTLDGFKNETANLENQSVRMPLAVCGVNGP